MEPRPADIAYAAFTDAATFMLDADGICRWTVTRPGARGGAEATLAERCVGAQYVASLDVTVQGGLIELPRLGCPLLFARLDARGRISLLRTGPVVRFEKRGAARDLERIAEGRELSPRGKDDDDSGVHPTPRATPIPPASAPELDPYADESATLRFSPAQVLKAMRTTPPEEDAVAATVRAPEPPTHRSEAMPPRGVLPRRRPRKDRPLPPPPRVHSERAETQPAAAAPSGVLLRGSDEEPGSDPLVAQRGGRGRRG